MAITVITNPEKYSPVYNDIVAVVSSTNVAQCNFRYVCDVYVDGVYVTRLKLFPSGSNNYAAFRVNRILENYVSPDNPVNITDFTQAKNSICSFVLKFGEEYDASANCDAGTTVFPNLYTTGTFYAWNGAIQYDNFGVGVFTNPVTWTRWDADSASPGLFMTTHPTLKLDAGSRFVYSFINNTTDEAKYLQIKTYDISGSLISTYRSTNAFSTVSSTDDRMLHIGVGPWNVNLLTLSTGVQPIISNNVYSYTVELLDSGLNISSETRTFRMDWDTYPFRSRLYWLNRLGGYDFFDFRQRNKSNVSISRESFDKFLPDLVGPTWRYELGSRGRTITSVNAQESVSYQSNWVNLETSKWLVQLYTSPEVYEYDIVDPCSISTISTDRWPLIPRSTNYEFKNTNTNKLISYTFECDRAYQINVQRN